MTVILVLATIAFFLGLDWLLHRRQRHAAPTLALLPVTAGPRLPSGVFFARSHTWLNLFPSGRAWLGVDDFVAGLLERPRIEPLAKAGSRVERGEPLFALTDGEHRLTVRSPLSARVIAANPDLLPHAARSLRPGAAPFFEGWVLEIEPERAADLKSFLIGEETAAWIRGEFARLRDVLAGTGPALSPAALHDGGMPAPGAMKHVGPETWRRFEQEFLGVE
jgi:glycine cleavage system H lipoate-binding protein